MTSTFFVCLVACLIRRKILMLIIIAKSLICNEILLFLNFCEEILQAKSKLFYIVTLSCFLMDLSYGDVRIYLIILKIFITFPSSASTEVYPD